MMYLNDNKNNQDFIGLLYNEFYNFPEKNFNLYMQNNLFYAVISTNLTDKKSVIY